MKAYKKSLWIVTAVTAVAVTFAWNYSSAVAGDRAKQYERRQLSDTPLPWESGQVYSSQGGPCESTGFEVVDLGCSWELGWMCGSTYAFSAGPPIAASCTGVPAADFDCCIAAPNPLNGWYVSGTSQHCNQPHVSDLNPATGEQHMRFQTDPAGGNPAGCTGFGTACRVNAFTPTAGAIPSDTQANLSLDVAMEHPFFDPVVKGSLTWFSVQDGGPAGINTYIYFLYYGLIFVYDYAGPSFAFAGYIYQDTYNNFKMEVDPCQPSPEIRYYWNDNLTYSTTVFGGQTTFSRAIFAWNNIPGATDSMDIDNYIVTRQACPQAVCGDGTIAGDEECEPGADETCCPGRCGEDCICARDHEMCGDPRPLGNGVNGPYLTDGGMYSYTADTPFTSIHTCGSDYDTVLHWDLFNNCTESVLLNDECNNFGPELGQDPGDPAAPCYIDGGPDPGPGEFPLASCLCSPTTPGNTYEFLVDEYGGDGRPALCGNNLITITKKTACGSPILGGACCDRITGTCSQVAGAMDCDGQFEIYSDNKTCDLVECEGIQGACCNSAPGAGGACMQTLSADCQGNNLTWTPGADCASVNCTEDDGACCNRLAGSCSLTLQAACNCPDCVWTEDAACGSVPCTPIQGACCVRSEQTAECTQESQAGCDAIGGEWTRETDCANVTCDPLFVPIPTVSEWGLVIMALLLLVGGKVYFGRRQTVTA